LDLKQYLLHPPEKLDRICRLIPYSFIEEIVEEEFLEEQSAQLPDDLPLILEKAGHGIHLMDIVIDDRAYKLLVRGGWIANISLIYRGEEYTGLEALEKLEENMDQQQSESIGYIHQQQKRSDSSYLGTNPWIRYMRK